MPVPLPGTGPAVTPAITRCTVPGTDGSGGIDAGAGARGDRRGHVLAMVRAV